MAFARIENHFFMNEGWFTTASSSPKAHKLKDIPGVIIQGRYDMCTPAVTAWDLHRAWPEAEFQMIPDAGHSFEEPGIFAAHRRRDGPVRRLSVDGVSSSAAIGHSTWHLRLIVERWWTQACRRSEDRQA